MRKPGFFAALTDQPEFDKSLARLYYYGTRLDDNGNWTNFLTDPDAQTK